MKKSVIGGMAATAFALFGPAGTAHAIVIPIGPSFTTTGGGDHIFSLLTPSNATGDATLELSFTGDYDLDFENATITLDS